LTLSAELVEARHGRRCVVAPTERDDAFSLEDGYAVGAEVAELWQEAGHQVAGIKIGLTNMSTWDRLGLSAPVWGPIYRESVLDAAKATPEAPVVFPLGPLAAARIEAEIILELSAELGPGAGPDTIADSIGWAALGFEFVDCHYAGWILRPPDLVADFCAHAGLVIGARAALNAAELLALDSLPVELASEGSLVCTGSGDRVAGGPLAAVAAVLAAPNAPVVPKGGVIATGALTGGAHPVGAAQDWHCAPGLGVLKPVCVRTR